MAKQHIEIIKLRVREEKRQNKAEADALEQSGIGDDSTDTFFEESDSE